MTLALLITAATGAWADSFSTEAYTADATLSAVSVTGNTTLTINEGVTVTVNNGLTINSGATLTVTGGGNLVVNGATGAKGSGASDSGSSGSTAIAGSGQLAIANATIIATGGTGGNGGYDQFEAGPGGDGAPAVSGVSISIQTGSLTAIGGAGGIGGTSTLYQQKNPYDGETANAFSSFPNISDATLSYSTDNVTYTKYESGNTALYRYMKIEPLDGPAVTIADGNGEASFKMPQYDVTATYTIKRDISVDVTATMGDGTDGVRYRVKKAQQGEGYEPADMNMMQVLALVAVNDGIEQKALTLDQDYFCRIYKLDEQTLQPEGDGVELIDFDFAPGLYALKAVAKDGSNYAGETALSNTFQLFQGYEVTVPAKEFITYYKDEPLYVEDEAAELYTISSVNGDQAVLSDKSDAMPSNTPMLVYNKSNETKVILLIPCAEPDMALTVAPEFQGTLTATTIAASTDAQTNYAFNGKQFVFVKDDLAIGANKAWLEIPTGMMAGAREINLVFGEATKITNTNITNLTNGDWYDLNGRKLQGIPTKKGVYILNGKKVVVK